MIRFARPLVAALAVIMISALPSIPVSVDEGTPVDIRTDAYFEVSPQRAVRFADDPVFGASPGWAAFVAAGWMAEVRGLGLGCHTVVGSPVSSFGLPQFTVNVQVSRDGRPITCPPA